MKLDLNDLEIYSELDDSNRAPKKQKKIIKKIKKWD